MRTLEITDAVATLCKEVNKLTPSDGRLMVALNGAPASGKTTLAEQAADALVAAGLPAVFVPMDGFHMDNRVLDQRGRRAEKGAPDTFDAHGFVHSMKRLKTGEQVVMPTFDRDRDIAIAGAIVVEPETKIVVAEGNYLCFDQSPWDQLMPLWDLSVYLDITRETLRKRLIQRWLGLGLTQEAAEHRSDVYDLANADLISNHRMETDLVLQEKRS